MDAHQKAHVEVRMKRTFKGTVTRKAAGDSYGQTTLTVNKPGPFHTWVTIHDPDGRYIGNIEGVANLRRFAEAILTALPPKRGSK